jgi:ABC-type lipoprotein export system ATPase subunit
MTLIQVRDLHKTYDAGDVQVHALRGVSFDIDGGEWVAIVGTSGSGKSTLMHILGCLDRPTRGSYRLDGDEVGGLDRDRLAAIRNRAIGFVFQSFNLLPRTSAVENVELPLLYAGVPAAERRRRAVAVLSRLGLGKRLAHTPDRLSGGEQQRVAIARAVVGGPRVVLADEPTGNLDSRTSEEIMGVFRDLVAAGITVVLVTHERDIAAAAARVIHIRDGQILDEDGAPAPRGQAGGPPPSGGRA